MKVQAEHRGVMIALYPEPAICERMAVPGGEAPENMHVTLAYLGKLDELPGDVVQRAVQAVRQVCERFGPLAGEFGGIGRFAGDDDQDVVHATCDVPGLVELRVALCWALRQAGVPAKSKHGYDPHITIQYVEKGQDSPVTRMDPVPCSFSSVWVVSGDTERHECPLAGDSTVLAFTITQRRAFRRERLAAKLLAQLQAVQDGTAAPSTIDAIERATGMNPRRPTDRARIRARLRRLTATAQKQRAGDLALSGAREVSVDIASILDLTAQRLAARFP
jgi:2'-5' RNA ligase